MWTAENITDEQLRELHESTRDYECRRLVRQALGYPEFAGWSVPDASVVRMARARCAKLINARSKAVSP